MWISTRGRYALRVMVDLAENNNGEYIPLKDIAKRQEISEKYLESIMVTMSKAGIIKGLRGKGGGYKLALAPMDITVGRILKVTEKSLAPVSCLEMQPNLCKRSPACKTVRVWQEMYRVVDEYIESVTIADLVDEIDSSDFYVDVYKRQIQNLKQNGVVMFIDRDLEHLLVTDDRPLSKDTNAVAKLYEERYPLYTKYGDLRVPNNYPMEISQQELDEMCIRDSI